MLTKNISIEIKDNETVPTKETYITFFKSNKQVKIVQKFIDETKNQSITLNLNECERLVNLFYHYLFKGKYEYLKDKMLIFKKD
jgi:5,10-methenyltetrahydromethanopterin hydrogenase